MQEELTFGVALERLKRGKLMSRAGWNRIGMWIELQVPDTFSKMKQPYLFITPCPRTVVPWVASQADLLAEDWFQLG